MPDLVKNNRKTEYAALRAALIGQGTNLARWARKNRYPLTTVYLAARGLRSGIRATAIRKHLEQTAYES